MRLWSSLGCNCKKKKTAAAAALSFPAGQRTATARVAILAKPVPSPWRVPREEGSARSKPARLDHLFVAVMLEMTIPVGRDGGGEK